MKAASLSEIKKELSTVPSSRVLELCMKLAKYKKDNKEFLTYLLYESGNEQAYITDIKNQINEQFQEMNKSNVYLAKKSLRKILRSTNKYIKYSGIKQTEAELLIYFCNKLKKSGIPIQSSLVLSNLYDQQIKKINKAISSMHEDLQYDYLRELEKISD